MNTRIRYVATDTGVLRSARVLVGSGGQEFYANINLTSNFTYSITDASTGAVVAEGEGTSLPNAKIKAKKALMNLGVAFESETRSRTTTNSAA